MKMRNKRKVYPSTSSTPSTFPVTSPAGDSLSVLNLLPAAILSLAVVLSLEDREVLAYMITRSIKSTNPSSKKTSNTHKIPLFDCDCFDCYTSYWFKWDSSPNRELIHQAIEAFEESLTSNEQCRKKGKKKEKMGHRRLAGKTYCQSPEAQVLPEYDVALVEVKAEEKKKEKMGHRRLDGKTYCPSPEVQVLPEYDVALVEVKAEENGENPDGVLTVEVVEEEPPENVTPAVVLRDVTPARCQHKGLARKVLPDVIGLLNWRLWSLWNPNV